MKTIVIGALGVLCAAELTMAKRAASAAGEKHAPQDHIEITAQAVSWSPVLPSDPSGPRITVLAGDPRKPGLYTMRLKLPDGYRSAPHWHPQTEYTTVLSGTLLYGIGDKWDDASMHSLGPGDFLAMTGGTHHYAGARGETIVQVSGIGPTEQVRVK
jgi:quercetin dioxygenase-like cupin family protein